MAILNQIGGISTGGLTGALEGPLSALFGSKQGTNLLQYPSDLNNDPSRMHIVQFEIKNIIPSKFKSDTFDAVKNVSEGETTLDTAVNAGKAVAKTAGSVAEQTLNIAMTKQYIKKKSTISLYMPDTLSMNYNHSYDELSLGAATKGLSRIYQGGAAIAESLADSLNSTGSIIDRGIKAFKNLPPDPTTELLGTLADEAFKTQIRDLALATQARAINPQLQLLYKGTGLRTFSMEFLFTPKSKKESDSVSAIINTFIYASAPDVSGEGGMYFIPPSVFNINFLMAKTGNFSGFSEMIQKTANGIVPGLGSLAGSLAEKIGIEGSKGSTNDRLFQVGDCVLENVSVDYAPTGQWSAYNDGAPVQTRLTLQFKEIFLSTRQSMKKGLTR